MRGSDFLYIFAASKLFSLMKRRFFIVPILMLLAVFAFSGCDRESDCTVFTYVNAYASGSHSVPTIGVADIYAKHIAKAQSGRVIDEENHIISSRGGCETAMLKAKDNAVAGCEKAKKEVLLSTYQDCRFVEATDADKWNLHMVVKVEGYKTVEHYYILEPK